MTKPLSRTSTRAQIAMTRVMSCSTRRTPIPSEANCSEHGPTPEGLVRVEPRTGLVEEEHRGRGGQGAGHLDEAGQPGGEGVGRLVGDVEDPDPCQLVVRLLGRRPPARELVLLDLGGHLHVLACGQGAEQLEALEGPAQAQARPHVWLDPGHVMRTQAHASPRRALQTRDDIEQRRLAGAVGPDQPVHLSGGHVEGDGIEGLQSAEAHRDVFDATGRAASGSANGGHLGGIGDRGRRVARHAASRPVRARRASHHSPRYV